MLAVVFVLRKWDGSEGLPMNEGTASARGPIAAAAVRWDNRSTDGVLMWWLLWLGVALLLGVVEFFTLTVAFGILAGSALGAAVAAGLGAPVSIQLLTFAVLGGVGLVAVRPIAKRHLALPPVSRDGSDALVGRTATVTHEVSANGGLVHLSGEDWSARAYDEDLVIPPGVRVEVFQIEGATALVHPRDSLPEPRPREG